MADGKQASKRRTVGQRAFAANRMLRQTAGQPLLRTSARWLAVIRIGDQYQQLPAAYADSAQILQLGF